MLPVNINALPRLGLWPNWTTRDVKAPQYLLLGAGPAIEEIAAATTETMASAAIPGVRIGLAAEIAPVPGMLRAIRALQTDRMVHHTATDVVLRRQGNDLFVKLQVTSRSALRWLRRVLRLTVFGIAFGLLFGLYYKHTDARGSLVQEYTRKWTTASGEAREAILSGMQFDPVTQAWVVTGPVSLAEIFRRDPKLFLTSVAGPPAILAGIIGAAVMFAPRGLIRLPCRFVGWPTPDEFDSLVAGHAAWVEGTLSALLYSQFGIHEAQKIPVRG